MAGREEGHRAWAWLAALPAWLWLRGHASQPVSVDFCVEPFPKAPDSLHGHPFGPVLPGSLKKCWRVDKFRVNETVLNICCGRASDWVSHFTAASGSSGQ